MAHASLSIRAVPLELLASGIHKEVYTHTAAVSEESNKPHQYIKTYFFRNRKNSNFIWYEDAWGLEERNFMQKVQLV